MKEGPRIYNLFPLLVGTVQDWKAQLPRIADMGFNWVFLNPVHYPGFSGSLYAVKDYYRLNPLFANDGDQDAQLRDFVRAAEAHGLSVMLDLVINHTAKDSILADEHPEWFAREPDGSVRSPRAVDPDDHTKVTVWGDLAEIDYSPRPQRQELLAYWQRLARHYIQLGFHGFRCDAAYKVPGAAWAEIIGSARAEFPQTHFFAETLGARLEEVAQLHAAGFDFFFNSAKWWDFHADWLLEQYERFRHIAPSVAFPESHDTERLAAETGGSEIQSRVRYLFAAFFSAGVMMPIGYEFGFRRKLHVVKARPRDWEAAAFDLTAFIRETNRMKAGIGVLNEEGPQERLTAQGAPVVALLRSGRAQPGRVLFLLNTDPDRHHDYLVELVETAMDSARSEIRDVTPQATPLDLLSSGRLSLAPWEARVLYAPAGAPGGVRKKA